MKASADLRKTLRYQEKEFKKSQEDKRAIIRIEEENYTPRPKKWRPKKKIEKVTAKQYWEEQLENVKKGNQRLKAALIRFDLGGSMRETPNIVPDGAEELIRPKTADLERYKERVKKGSFKGNAKRELREINILMENEHETYTRHDWDYLYKRWNKLNKRSNDPTARFAIAGAVPGKLSKEKQQEVNQRESIKNLLNFSKKELENVKQSNISRSKTG